MKFLLLILSLHAASFSAFAEQLPPGHPPIDKSAPAAALSQKGSVLEVIDVPNYSYLRISQNNQERWLAAPTVKVKVNDVVSFDNGMPMTDFYSKTLKRTFKEIAFVSQVVISQ